MNLKIGVLNVQGAVSEHADSLRDAGAAPVLVKSPEDLNEVNGLIIPGGESTTIGRLIRRYGLFEPIVTRARAGMPLFGTCAGMILLAGEIQGQEEPHLALMNTLVDRNSFGRQRESFEAEVQVKPFGEKAFPGVFIRAPHIVQAGSDVEVLSVYQDRIVAARQGNLLATSFHPELTQDCRFHEYFVDMVKEASTWAKN